MPAPLAFSVPPCQLLACRESRLGRIPSPRFSPAVVALALPPKCQRPKL